MDKTVRAAIRTAVGAWRGPTEFPWIPLAYCDDVTASVVAAIERASPDSGRETDRG